jgi:hypothetical protein
VHRDAVAGFSCSAEEAPVACTWWLGSWADSNLRSRPEAKQGSRPVPPSVHSIFLVSLCPMPAHAPCLPFPLLSESGRAEEPLPAYRPPAGHVTGRPCSARGTEQGLAQRMRGDGPGCLLVARGGGSSVASLPPVAVALVAQTGPTRARRTRRGQEGEQGSVPRLARARLRGSPRRVTQWQWLARMLAKRTWLRTIYFLLSLCCARSFALIRSAAWLFGFGCRFPSSSSSSRSDVVCTAAGRSAHSRA